MKKLNRDQFAKFIFAQSDKIQNYNFDLFHDITKLVNFAYDSNNYRNEYKEIITDKPVQKTYFLYIKSFGSWLFDEDQKENIKATEDNEYLNKYKVVITLNCDYIYNKEFAEVTKIK